jgi:propanol-preferring alcohol dehydrogenase
MSGTASATAARTASGAGSNPGVMRAVQLVAWQAPAEVREVPKPVPGAGEVLLRVRAAGLCHSDLHLMHWPAGTVPYQLPFTLGHEVVGTVEELGPGAEGIEPDETVLVYGPWGCGCCPQCSLGAEHLCHRKDLRRGTGCGIGRDGGLAEYLVLPSPRVCVPLGELDPVSAAPLADAALTPYHAVKRALRDLQPGSTAVVIGVGGLGHMAVQLLRVLSGCRIVAIDRRQDALDVATAGGADVALQADGLTAEDVRRAAGGPAELVIDCVGVDATLALSAASVAPGGHLSVIGVGGGTLPFRFGVIPFETTVVFSNWGTRAELAEVVALAQAGVLHIEVERVALDEVPAAYERLEAGDVRGRVVAVP